MDEIGNAAAGRISVGRDVASAEEAKVTSEVDYERQLLRVDRNGAVTVLADESKLGAAPRRTLATPDVDRGVHP